MIGKLSYLRLRNGPNNPPLLIFITSVGAANKQFKVFQNSLDPGDFGDSAAGAILNESGQEGVMPAVLDDFTLCIRFQLKVLGSKAFSERGMLVNIGDM